LRIKALNRGAALGKFGFESRRVLWAWDGYLFFLAKKQAHPKPMDTGKDWDVGMFLKCKL